MLALQSCPTLCSPMDYSSPGSSVHGIFQARILEWVAIPFFRESSQPKDVGWVSCIAGGCFTTEPPGKPYIILGYSIGNIHPTYLLSDKEVFLFCMRLRAVKGSVAGSGCTNIPATWANMNQQTLWYEESLIVEDMGLVVSPNRKMTR